MSCLCILLTLHFLGTFMLIYSFGNYQTNIEIRNKNNDTYDYELKMPSVLDLKEFEKDKVLEYIKSEVNPAYYYFILKKEINDKKRSTEACVYSFIVISITYILLFEQFIRINLIDSRLLCLIISLLICFLVDYVLYYIYKKTLYIKPFKTDELKLEFKTINYNQHFNISDKDRFNNFLINKHLYYLLSIKDEVSSRRNIQSFTLIIPVIAYFVFKYNN